MFLIQIIERHITIDKTWKGSDHFCSLEPAEFTKLVSNIRSLEKALGCHHKVIQKSELACYKKLGKTIIYSKDLPQGHILHLEDLKVKVAEPKGMDGSYIYDIVGKVLKRHVKEDESVTEQDLV